MKDKSKNFPSAKSWNVYFILYKVIFQKITNPLCIFEKKFNVIHKLNFDKMNEYKSVHFICNVLYKKCLALINFRLRIVQGNYFTIVWFPMLVILIEEGYNKLALAS